METLVKICCPLTCAALILACGSPAPAGEPEIKSPIPLPEVTSTPVITLDFATSTRGDSRRRPYLAIYADGRAVVTSPGPEAAPVSGQIPPGEFNRLLRELVVEHQILQCDSSRLAEKVRLTRLKRRRPQPDATSATTSIRIRGANTNHHVQCRALGLTASQLPDLEQVRSLLACQQRLENVAAIIRAGGYENVDAVLTAANRQLRQETPQVRQLTSHELALVDVRPDGTRYLQFTRRPDADGVHPPGGFVTVSVYQRPGQAPEIAITAGDS